MFGNNRLPTSRISAAGDCDFSEFCERKCNRAFRKYRVQRTNQSFITTEHCVILHYVSAITNNKKVHITVQQ